MDLKLELKIIRIGSSEGVVIPKAVLEAIGKKLGDKVKVKLVVEDE